MKCPVCGHWVDDDDYWCGDKCLRCALAEERERQDVTNQGGRQVVLTACS